MISTRDRRQAIELIDEAVTAGARKARACEELGLSVRTVQRWVADGEVGSDARPTAVRAKPQHALSQDERDAILAACHAPKHADLPPSQIVPRLADQGIYLASESSFYRVLREAEEQHHRGRARPPRRLGEPPSHTATGPCQVWSWDITYLPGPVRGMFFYLYLILDLYSRKIVGWEVHERESAAHAATLVRRAVLAEDCIDRPLVLHADNGSAQKGSTLLATLQALGISPSYSRPRVSDDNPFSEAIFRTCKYRPDYPASGFESLQAARHWVLGFLTWYNHEHRHSAIRFVTPEQRHTGHDHTILAQRAALYEQAKANCPRRWSGNTRNWMPIGAVTLNARELTSPPPAEAA
jgi:putative transposase